MRSHRLFATAGISAGLAGLVAAVVATTTQPGTSADSTADGLSSTGVYRGPVATASGDGGGAVMYPALVDVHLDRAYAAMAAAESAADAGLPGRAATNFRIARLQALAAWTTTRYVIRTTPPPPPPGDDRAGAGGGAPGSAFGAPPDTALALFTLQHDLVTTAAGLLSDNAALNNRLVNAMKATAIYRDRAIAYIHRVAPPAPPGGDRAGASGAPVTATFDSTMPSVLPFLDDEIQALQGTRDLNTSLPPDVGTQLGALVTKDTQTKATINTFWPPVVGDD
jgi:hypothetical protein